MFAGVGVLGTEPSVRSSRGHVYFLKYLFTRIAGFHVETRTLGDSLARDHQRDRRNLQNTNFLR